MKLSILIFVLTTIIYSCKCAPSPDWIKDLQQDMQKMNQQMYENQQQMDKTFKAIGQQLQNSQKDLEEQMKNLGKFAANATNGLQDLNGKNSNIAIGHSTVSTSQMINGHRIDITVIEDIINNVKYRNISKYNSATNKTTIEKYECSLSPNSECELKSSEVKDGYPDSW